jgi:hypothetical protein
MDRHYRRPASQSNRTIFSFFSTRGNERSIHIKKIKVQVAHPHGAWKALVGKIILRLSLSTTPEYLDL